MHLYVFRLDDQSGTFKGVVLIVITDPPAVWRKLAPDQAPEPMPHMVASREKAELETELTATLEQSGNMLPGMLQRIDQNGPTAKWKVRLSTLFVQASPSYSISIRSRM
jgi:hypothetical protein